MKRKISPVQLLVLAAVFYAAYYFLISILPPSTTTDVLAGSVGTIGLIFLLLGIVNGLIGFFKKK